MSFIGRFTVPEFPHRALNPGGGGGGVLPFISYIRTFRPSGYHFQGSVLNRVYNLTFLCLKQGLPSNLLLFSPFDHIIFADFVRFVEMRENANLCTVFSVLNTVMLGPVLNRVRNYSTFS